MSRMIIDSRLYQLMSCLVNLFFYNHVGLESSKAILSWIYTWKLLTKRYLIYIQYQQDWLVLSLTKVHTNSRFQVGYTRATTWIVPMQCSLTIYYPVLQYLIRSASLLSHASQNYKYTNIRVRGTVLSLFSKSGAHIPLVSSDVPSGHMTYPTISIVNELTNKPLLWWCAVF